MNDSAEISRLHSPEAILPRELSNRLYAAGKLDISERVWHPYESRSDEAIYERL